MSVLAGVNRLSPRQLLLDWRTTDRSLNARTGQIGTLARASTATVTDQLGATTTIANNAPCFTYLNGFFGLLLAADTYAFALGATAAQLSVAGVTTYEELIAQRASDADANYHDVLAIGSSTIPGNGLFVAAARTADSPTTLIGGVESGGSWVGQTSVSVSYAIGDRLERVLSVTPSGVATLSLSLNGAAVVTGGAGAAAGWPPNLDTPVVSFNGTGSNAGTMLRRAVRIAIGNVTFAQIQQFDLN